MNAEGESVEDTFLIEARTNEHVKDMYGQWCKMVPAEEVVDPPNSELLTVLDETIYALNEAGGYIYNTKKAECCHCGKLGASPSTVKHDEGCVQPMVDKAYIMLKAHQLRKNNMNTNIERLTESQLEVIKELSRTFDRLGAERGVFAALHSWGDTLPEVEIAKMLRELNEEHDKSRAKSVAEGTE